MRPASARAPRSRGRAPVGGPTAAQQSAERGEGVVGEVSGPGEVPDGAEQGVVIGRAQLLMDRVGEGPEEVRAAAGQRVEDRLVGLGEVERRVRRR